KMAESKTQRARRVLAERITSGEYPPDSQLPSISAIEAEFGISKGSAASVVSQLRHDGLVVSRHGSGTFVRGFEPIRRSSPSRLAAAQWGEGKAIQDSDTGKRPRSVDVVVAEVPAPMEVAGVLGVVVGAAVISRFRRFVVENRTVQLATSYFRRERVQGTPIVYTDTGPGGTYARLAEIGHRPVRFVERLRARMPLPEEASKLDLPPGTPAIEITRLAFDESDECVEVNRMILDASAYLLEYAFNAENQGHERQDIIKVDSTPS
ncbi:MAG: GntR family transcriptional regulator, partial [Stackebrandtia sp.]